MPRLSAAIDGWRIHCCRRATASPCRFSTCSWTDLGAAAARAWRGNIATAPTAAAPWRKVRRLIMGRDYTEIPSGGGTARWGGLDDAFRPAGVRALATLITRLRIS